MFKEKMFIAKIVQGEYSLPQPPAVSARLCEADSPHTASSGGFEDALLPSEPSSPWVHLGVLEAKLL